MHMHTHFQSYDRDTSQSAAQSQLNDAQQDFWSTRAQGHQCEVWHLTSCWTGSIHSPILMGQKPVVNFLSPARHWGCVHLIPMLYSTSFPVAETCSNILKNIETISWGLLATQFGRSPTEISWRPAQICAPVWQFGNLYDLWFEQTMAVTPIVFRIPENGETNEFVQDVPNIYRLLTNKCTVC